MTDNSGGLKTVVPVQNVPITEDASFDTIATDYADNQETCTIDVKVISELNLKNLKTLCLSQYFAYALT